MIPFNRPLSGAYMDPESEYLIYKWLGVCTKPVFTPISIYIMPRKTSPRIRQ